MALTDHAKEVALGVLALISLFMVSNIVKKNSPVPVVAEQAPPVEPRELNVREEAVGEAGEGVVLEPGMLFTIEPMINLGRPHVKVLPDGWTAVTRDRELSAQFEHTVVVTKTGCEILTQRARPLMNSEIVPAMMF